MPVMSTAEVFEAVNSFDLLGVNPRSYLWAVVGEPSPKLMKLPINHSRFQCSLIRYHETKTLAYIRASVKGEKVQCSFFPESPKGKEENGYPITGVFLFRDRLAIVLGNYRRGEKSRFAVHDHLKLLPSVPFAKS